MGGRRLGKKQKKRKRLIQKIFKTFQATTFVPSEKSQRQARRTKHHHLTTIPSKSLTGAAIRARRNARVAHATDTYDSSTQEAFPGLPQEVVVTHFLRSDTDPTVLARLRAVNRAMRDAVDAVDMKGLLVEELSAEEAAQCGYLDTL